MPSQFAGRPSGVARVAFELLNSLIAIGGFEYILRSPWSREQLPAFLRDKPLEVATVRRNPILVLDVVLQRLTLPGYCAREKIDLIVNVDPYGSAAGGRSRVMIVHDLYFRTIPEHISKRARFTNDLIFRLMLRGNSDIVTVSTATQKDLEFWYPQTKGRITAIHSATSLRVDKSKQHQMAVDRPYVLVVGNATPNKNFAVLAQAIDALSASYPDLALVHVGDDPDEILIRTLRQLNLSQKVVRFSGIDDAKLTGLYSKAICLCVPSIYEGFCFPILEAQMCGCPVISSNRSAMPEIAGVGAILVDPQDPLAFAGALKDIMERPEIVANLVQRGFENAARFSWARTAQCYYELFEKILSR